jgi:Flp pilus assembly protein TadB
MRFDIKPRYYDPVKEEIEQRTAQIKRELQADGVLPVGDEDEANLQRNYGSSLRGAFSSGSPLTGRKTTSITSAGLIRLIIFVLLIGAIVGYIYYGPQFFYVVLYVLAGIGMLVMLVKLRRKRN